MKACKSLTGCIFLLFLTQANASDISCLNTLNKACNYTAKNKGDDIYIYSSKQPTAVFSIPETETSVEIFSFLKKDKKYLLIKETSNSNKAKEILSFNDELNEFEYLYLTSDVDIKQSNKYWHGIYCFLSNASISDSAKSPFEWAFANVCKKHSESQGQFKYVGSDLFFSVDSIIDGNISKMHLIALNAKESDNVNISNFACLENCPSVNRFTGKINDKYVIKMFLNLEEGNINGSYYYDKTREIIPIKGVMKNKEITLSVEGPKGGVKEVFVGKLDNNKIHGVWNNKQSDASYPFVLYRSLY